MCFEVACWLSPIRSATSEVDSAGLYAEASVRSIVSVFTDGSGPGFSGTINQIGSHDIKLFLRYLL